MDMEDVPGSKCSCLPGDAADSVCFDEKNSNNKTQNVFKADVVEVRPGLGIPASSVSLGCLSVLLVKSASFMAGGGVCVLKTRHFLKAQKKIQAKAGSIWVPRLDLPR